MSKNRKDKFVWNEDDIIIRDEDGEKVNLSDLESEANDENDNPGLDSRLSQTIGA